MLMIHFLKITRFRYPESLSKIFSMLNEYNFQKNLNVITTIKILVIPVIIVYNIDDDDRNKAK